MKTPQELLDYSISEIGSVSVGDIFLVKELFKGYEWNKYTLSTRITLGTLFLNYAQNSNTLKVLGKTKQNQQKYEKI